MGRLYVYCGSEISLQDGGDLQLEMDQQDSFIVVAWEKQEAYLESTNFYVYHSASLTMHPSTTLPSVDFAHPLLQYYLLPSISDIYHTAWKQYPIQKGVMF